MTSRGLLTVVLFVVGYITASGGQTTVESDSLPLYQTLYEEGFYSEAIAILDSLVTADTACSRKSLRYLAFCFIASGERSAGEEAFDKLLTCDPAFRCDTLFTSPKILEVFRSVLARHTPENRTTDTTVAAAGAADTAPGDRTDSDTAATPAKVLPTPGEAVAMAASLQHPPPIRFLPGLLPGGVGQFTQKQWVKSALFLVLQAAAAGGYVWAYRTRQTFYDPEYGWYAPINEADYSRYTTYARIGGTVFIGTYTVSIIDFFRTMRHQKPSSP